MSGAPTGSADQRCSCPDHNCEDARGVGIAEGDRPELLSEDGQHYADGTVILALDPENRFLGTCAGEDVKLSDSGFEAVQEAMREDSRSVQWDAALRAGAEEYAELLDRPW